ncbi:MAG TPA: hypothetical protein DCO72_03640 [Ruminococcus sp.]|nr:hypothetical protein [Ruminococcus sp.]
MTLHDLSNSTDLQEVSDQMQENENTLRNLLVENPVPAQTISVKIRILSSWIQPDCFISISPV